MAAGALACGAPVFRPPADDPRAYQGMCSMLAIQQVEREIDHNLPDSSVQFMVSYNFEPRDLRRPGSSSVSYFFRVTQDRVQDVRSQLARHAEIACERVMPVVDPAQPQILLDLPAIEGVQEIRQVPHPIDQTPAPPPPMQLPLPPLTPGSGSPDVD